MTTEPTDAELKAMWQLHAADIGGIFYYARAVLAKWGAPAPAQDHLPLAITSAPERIWLDLGVNPYEDDVHFSHLHDLTWSQNNATGDGIEYVRADLAARGAERIK